MADKPTWAVPGAVVYDAGDWSNSTFDVPDSERIGQAGVVVQDRHDMLHVCPLTVQMEQYALQDFSVERWHPRRGQALLAASRYAQELAEKMNALARRWLQEATAP